MSAISITKAIGMDYYIIIKYNNVRSCKIKIDNVRSCKILTCSGRVIYCLRRVSALLAVRLT